MRLVLKIYDTTEYPKNCKTEQDVLDLFDSLPNFTDRISAYKELKNNKVVRFKNFLFFNLTKNGDFDKLKIVDVDENKLWTIDDCGEIVYYKAGKHNRLEEIR